jgi:hypothetical protein
VNLNNKVTDFVYKLKKASLTSKIVITLFIFTVVLLSLKAILHFNVSHPHYWDQYQISPVVDLMHGAEH